MTSNSLHRLVATLLLGLAAAAGAAPACQWTAVASGRNEAFNHFRFVDAEVGFGHDGRCLWRSGDGGRRWSRLPCAELPPGSVSSGIVDFQFLDRQRGWVLTESGALRATRNGGVDWTGPSFPDHIVRGFAFADAHHGWWVGEQARSGEADARGVVFATTDGGGTWQEQPTGADVPVRWRLNDVWAVGPREAWALGDGVLLHTRDGGRSWQRRDPPGRSRGPGARIRFNGGGVGVIVESPARQFLLSTDGGRRWQARPTPRRAPEIDGLLFVDARQAWATLLGRLYRSGDGGRSWQPLAIAAPEGASPAGEAPRLHGVQYLEREGLLWVALGGQGFASCRLRPDPRHIDASSISR